MIALGQLGYLKSKRFGKNAEIVRGIIILYMLKNLIKISFIGTGGVCNMKNIYVAHRT